jgi:predicted TIM-barrel fold metal-dependent hydrolase
VLPARGAQAQAAKTKVIDTHHHFYPPAYQKAWLDWEDARKIPHFASQVAWTRDKAVEELDKNGVATGVLSMASTPGTWFNLDAAGAGAMARTCNDFGAEMVRDYKGRFGLFATLSMIDIDATLKEIEYAFDTLHADGVGLRRQVARQPGLQAGVRGTQPPQGGGLRPSARRRVLRPA